MSPPRTDTRSHATAGLDDAPVARKVIPAWQTTLEASSFQYLLSPALLLDVALPSRIKTVDALLAKVPPPVEQPALAAPHRPASSTPVVAAVKAAVKRGRPKGMKQAKRPDAVASADFYDDDYEVRSFPRRRRPPAQADPDSASRPRLHP